MRAFPGVVFALVLVSASIVLSATANATVIAGGGFSSTYAGESVFTNLGPGETGQFSAIFFNDGTVAWQPGVVGLLVCAADKVTCNVPSNTGFTNNWHSQTVYATVGSTVEPGQNAFFIYKFTVPQGTPAGTATTFNGDLGLIATGALIRPEGYFHVNTTPATSVTVAIAPLSATLPVGALQQFSASTQPAGVQIKWTVEGGCGGVNSDGLFVATAMNSSSQPCSVVATALGSTAKAPISIFGQPTQLGCTSGQTSILANGGSTSAGVVTAKVSLRDINGNVVTNAGSPQISISNGTPALATMTPTGMVSPSSGEIAITITSTALTGNVQFSATASGLTGCSLIIPSVFAGPPAKTIASFSSNLLAADTTSTTTLTIDVADANGNRVVGDSLTQINLSQATGANVCSVVGVIGGSASITPGSGVATVIAGRVSFTIQAGNTPGQCVFNITPNNNTIAGTAATLTTQIVGVANRLSVISSNTPRVASSPGSCSSAGPNSDLSCTIVVVGVQDANGQLVTGDFGRPITATLDAGGNCTLAGGGPVNIAASPTSTQGGKATFLFTSAGAYPSCRVTFASTGVTGANTTIVFTGGAPDHLACMLSPASIAANTGAIAVGTIHVRDANENIASAGTYSVTMIRTSGTFTTLITSSTQYTSGGFATFSFKPGASAGTDIFSPSLTVGSLPMARPHVTCFVSVV